MSDQPTEEVLRPESAPTQSLSIRCLSGGLAFCVRSSETPAKTLQRGFLPFASEDGESWVERLQGLFYREEALSYPYQQITCYITPEAAVLVPRDLIQSGQEALWLLDAVETDALLAASSDKHYQQAVLSDPAKSLVMRSSLALYQFLRRTWLVFEQRPASQVALEHFLSQRPGAGQSTLLVLLEEGLLTSIALHGSDLIAYRQEKLRSLGGARTEAEEALFYIFALWRHLGLDAERDQLLLCQREGWGSAEEALPEAPALDELTSLLTPHLAQVSHMSYPAC